MRYGFGILGSSPLAEPAGREELGFDFLVAGAASSRVTNRRRLPAQVKGGL